MKEVILMLDSKKIHRIYVIDENGLLEGVITLRDIISKLVHEPSNYFGDFFDGVLPLPEDSRVWHEMYLEMVVVNTAFFRVIFVYL